MCSDVTAQHAQARGNTPIASVCPVLGYSQTSGCASTNCSAVLRSGKPV